MRKICCLNAIAACGLERLTDEYVQVSEPAEAEGILVRSASMHDMDFSENLHAIARAGAGVNNIPLDRCAEKGIVVFNTPGANKNGVKELVMAGLLLASRDIVGGIEWCRSQKDEPDIEKKVEKGKKAFAGCEIKGKKLGVIGLGAIGCEVANAAVGLGMDVYGYDPFISVNAAWMLSRSVKHILDVDTIYRECDYITVHVPLLDSTKHMICKESIDKMRDGVVILNFARDLLVDDDAMEEALKSGKVKKYITYFPNARTAKMEGVIAIPHLGASTEESEDNCAKMAVRQLRDYIENGTINNSVNYPKVILERTDKHRIIILHENIPNIVASFSAELSKDGINIENMLNRSRGNNACTVIDTGDDIKDDVIEQIKSLPSILSVRLIKD